MLQHHHLSFHQECWISLLIKRPHFNYDILDKPQCYCTFRTNYLFTIHRNLAWAYIGICRICTICTISILNLIMVIDLTKTAYYSICNWLCSLLLLVCSSVMRCGMYDIPWSIFKWLRNATPLFTVSFTISPLLQILHFIMCSSLSAIW